MVITLIIIVVLGVMIFGFLQKKDFGKLPNGERQKIIEKSMLFTMVE